MRGNDVIMKEKDKVKAIERVLSGKTTIERAAVTVGVTTKWFKRLIEVYQKYGATGLSHKSRGKIPHNKSDKGKSSEIVALYQNKYFGFNFTHFQEKLMDIEKTKSSYGHIYNLLTAAGISSPRANRHIKEANQHPSRERKENFGELVQMDASLHLWFGTEKAQLHAAIDDATGHIIGAYFDPQETLNGYYHVFHQILTNHGIPMAFYTDKRTIFEYKKKNVVDIEKDTFTQFATACDKLGVEIITTSVAQAKGRVERLFQTLQDRLINEMRLANITTIQEANLFLKDYIHVFNKKFGLPINYNKSVMEVKPTDEEINLYLAVISKRKVDKGATIKYNKQFFRPINKEKPVFLPPKSQVFVLEAFDNNLYILHGENAYLAKVFDPNTHTAQPVVFPEKIKKPYIPPKDHPWRGRSYKRVNAFYDVASAL